jgi:hypothetical protein
MYTALRHTVLRAPRTCVSRSFASAAADARPSWTPTLPHSDLVGRAFLRNLRLLKGLRTKDAFTVAVTGYDAAAVAGQLAALEPALSVVAVEGRPSGASAFVEH